MAEVGFHVRSWLADGLFIFSHLLVDAIRPSEHQPEVPVRQAGVVYPEQWHPSRG